MPIISSIGRRHVRTRVLVWSIYVVLTAGAATMVYPFLLMLSGSTKTAVDTPDARVIPRYLVSETALYRKHIEGLFNESAGTMQNAYGLWDATFTTLQPPKNPSPLLEDWTAFLKGNARTESENATSHFRSDVRSPGTDLNNPTWYILGYFQCGLSRGSVPYNLAKFRAELLKDEGSMSAINLKYGTAFVSMSAFLVIPPNYLNRFMDYPDTAFLQRVEEFVRQQPEKWRNYVCIGNQYRNYLRVMYGKEIAAYNAVKGAAFRSWNEVPAGPTVAACGPYAREDFAAYVREIVNPVFVVLDAANAPRYQQYLERKYEGRIERLNDRYGSQYGSFAEIPLSMTLPPAGMAKSDWKGFVEGWQDPASGEMFSASIETVRLTGPDFAFRDYLEGKYGSLEALNLALGTRIASWETLEMPLQDWQYEAFREMQGWLRWQFTIRNYVDVWNYLVINGRGLINTVIYCALAVLAALTVDPIAAYALSRFKPRSTYKVLLFLMMTMAFPAMVTQIPTFLLLRDLGMLNTFWALVLPGIANGYHIFLLKGFFDSLPKELYESAEIDGASEFTIFWNITMALSKPILAVIALGAFTGAYAAFMFALLICQDQKMWTLMVWLYQLQQNSGQGIVFASLIIAALPTFAVFVACQNVIMRGIVVPVEK